LCSYQFNHFVWLTSKPNEGFDLDSYDFTEYASALDGENPSSTDCDMESESIWTPARRHKKRKASASPLNQASYSEAVLLLVINTFNN
jgi:hypothetical protein